jgi:hypothetical protein
LKEGELEILKRKKAFQRTAVQIKSYHGTLSIAFRAAALLKQKETIGSLWTHSTSIAIVFL